jgi:hypothetical protein
MNPQEEEDAKVRNNLHQLARSVDRQLPYGWGFVVLAFPFGAGAQMNYISNAERADVVRAMYEFIEATKGRWAEHVPEQSAAAEDEQLARARQRVAELEGILREAKEVIESLCDHGTAAEAMAMLKAQQAEIDALKALLNRAAEALDRPETRAFRYQWVEQLIAELRKRFKGQYDEDHRD